MLRRGRPEILLLGSPRAARLVHPGVIHIVRRQSVAPLSRPGESQRPERPVGRKVRNGNSPRGGAVHSPLVSPDAGGMGRMQVKFPFQALGRETPGRARRGRFRPGALRSTSRSVAPRRLPGNVEAQGTARRTPGRIFFTRPQGRTNTAESRRGDSPRHGPYSFCCYHIHVHVSFIHSLLSPFP